MEKTEAARAHLAEPTERVIDAAIYGCRCAIGRAKAPPGTGFSFGTGSVLESRLAGAMTGKRGATAKASSDSFFRDCYLGRISTNDPVSSPTHSLWNRPGALIHVCTDGATAFGTSAENASLVRYRRLDSHG